MCQPLSVAGGEEIIVIMPTMDSGTLIELVEQYNREAKWIENHPGRLIQWTITQHENYNAFCIIMLSRDDRADKNSYLPFWHFLVKQGKYDSDVYFLDALADQFYADRRCNISGIAKIGIVRLYNYFFCVPEILTDGMRLARRRMAATGTEFAIEALSITDALEITDIDNGGALNDRHR